jgi:hypothetical protein
VFRMNTMCCRFGNRDYGARELCSRFSAADNSIRKRKRQLGCRTPYCSGGGAADAHGVEGAVDEDEGDDEEGGGKDVRQTVASLAGGELDS